MLHSRRVGSKQEEERKLKLLNCLWSLRNHFMSSQLESHLSLWSMWLLWKSIQNLNPKANSHFCPEPPKLTEHLLYASSTGLRASPHAVSFHLTNRTISTARERLSLDVCVCHSWFTWIFFSEYSEEERKVGLLIQTPSGAQATSLLHWEGKWVMSVTDNGTAQDTGWNGFFQL